MLERLFHGDALTEEVELSAPRDPLLDEEARALGAVAPKRRLHYTAGRHCARRALARLGIHDFALINGADRAPQWPPGVVGSLTHTGTGAAGLSGVVVAWARALRSVGLDAEEDTPLGQDLVPSIVTPDENSWLETLDIDVKYRAAKLIFCAKEAFYKCQYPLTRQFLGFQDAEVTLDLAAGTLVAGFTKPCGEFASGFAIGGRFVRERGLVAVGVTLR